MAPLVGVEWLVRPTFVAGVIAILSGGLYRLWNRKDDWFLRSRTAEYKKVYRFDLREAGALAHLEEHGFVVFRDILTSTECDHALDLLWDWIEAVRSETHRILYECCLIDSIMKFISTALPDEASQRHGTSGQRPWKEGSCPTSGRGRAALRGL